MIQDARKVPTLYAVAFIAMIDKLHDNLWQF